MEKNYIRSRRTPTRGKMKNNFQWFREWADHLTKNHDSFLYRYDGVRASTFRELKVNYDAFNNKLDFSDLDYVINPSKNKKNSRPAKMVNKDIISGKLKALFGMEAKRPFSFTIAAINGEAVDRREEEQYKLTRKFVIDSIMEGINQDATEKVSSQFEGQEPTPESEQKMQEMIQKETQAMTPDKVSKYMAREYKDSVEIMSQQLINSEIKRLDLKSKFNEVFKHLNLGRAGIMYVGQFNGKPVAWPVNPMRVTYDKSLDTPTIQERDSLVCEYIMTPSQFVDHFRDEMSDDDIRKFYDKCDSAHEKSNNINWNFNWDFSNEDYVENLNGNVSVFHCVWRAETPYKVLTYKSLATGETLEKNVSEAYKLNKEYGDISVRTEYYTEVYETWKAFDKYYKKQAIPGQYKNIENPNYCNLPYYGALVDNTNSRSTCIADRLIDFQHAYNILWYRIDTLMASDKGKKIALNINAVSKIQGMDIEKWMHYSDVTPYMFFDPTAEGSSHDAASMAKILDLSLASDINRYIETAEHVRRLAGISVGITEAVEGQISNSAAVSNTRQNLVQTSHILEPYFSLQNNIKKDVIKAVFEMSKVAYYGQTKKLVNVLDDLSIEVLKVNMNDIENNEFEFYVEDASKIEETKTLLKELSQYALNSQKAELSDILTLAEIESLSEAKEYLLNAEKKRQEYEQRAQQEASQNAQQIQKVEQDFKREEWAHDKDMVILKGDIDKEKEIAKAAIMGASFNPDQDADGDGINDFLEIAGKSLDIEVKMDKNKLDRDKFEHQKNIDKEKIKIDKRKLNVKKAN